MSLFSTPKAPQEDPAVKAARERAQTQADASLTSAIQNDLRIKMQSRLQRFGLTPTSAQAPISGQRPTVTAGFLAAP